MKTPFYLANAYWHACQSAPQQEVNEWWLPSGKPGHVRACLTARSVDRVGRSLSAGLQVQDSDILCALFGRRHLNSK